MKSKTHQITIKISVDRPITEKQARYAVWSQVHDLEIFSYGDEAWGEGKLTVPGGQKSRHA